MKGGRDSAGRRAGYSRVRKQLGKTSLLGPLLPDTRRGTKFTFSCSQGQSWGKWVETVDRFQLQEGSTFPDFGAAATEPDVSQGRQWGSGGFQVEAGWPQLHLFLRNWFCFQRSGLGSRNGSVFFLNSLDLVFKVLQVILTDA